MITRFTRSREMSYRVPDCPVCHQAHGYRLDIQYQADLPPIEGITREPVSLPVTPLPVWTNEVTFICLTKRNEHFTREVTITPQTDEEIINVTMHDPSPSDTSQPDTHGTTPLDELIKDDLATWFKTSRSTVQDFCKTMITTATGAIAIFFAVLKFLGGDTVGTTKVVTAAFAGVASAFFLLSALAYILGLEPQYIQHMKSLDDFLTVRQSRLKIMNTYIVWGTIFFALGTFLALLSFVFAYLKI